VSVELEKSITGDLGVSWREDGQKDFFSGTVTLAEETGIPLRFKGTVPSTNKVIHLRVLFPNGNAGIKSIEVISIDGKIVKRWGFQGSRK
jgi:hypothetical protein